ncbi:MAG: hypothetical protein HYT49_00045 [Candidatus Wildermuthbacteria bacterium]|nr:hypothetical protein [Candidatus Wildermuthbacteria bacterium]
MMSEVSPVSRDYCVHATLQNAPPWLWFADELPRSYQAELARGLYGMGIDAPIRLENPGVSHDTDFATIERSLRMIGDAEGEGDRRFREYILAHGPIVPPLSEEEKEQIRKLLALAEELRESEEEG